MKTLFLGLILLSNMALAASLGAFQGKNLSPNDPKKCGWHVEVSGDYVVLDSIPNYYNSSETACLGMISILFKCQGLSCAAEKSSVCDSTTGQTATDTLLFLNNGNMFYQNNCTNEGFQNYRH